MKLINKFFIWKDTIGIRENIFDKLLKIGKRITCIEGYNRSIESRIKLLEDKAFSDRARIGVLENKIESISLK